MRLLFLSNIFSPHVRGGYELGCQIIAEEFQARGNEVKVASSRNFGRLIKTSGVTSLDLQCIFEPVTAYEETHRESSDLYSAKMRHESLAGSIASNNLALRELIGSYKPDFIWCFNPLGLGPVGLLHILLTSKIPFCLHLMDNIDGVVKDHQKYVHSYACWTRLKRQTPAIACAPFIQTANENTAPFKQCIVIPNGVAFPDRQPIPQLLEGTSSGSSLRLVYFGQLAPKKGVLQTLRAVKALASMRKDLAITLDLFGSGPQSFLKDIDRTLDELSLKQCVRIHGQLEKRHLLKQLEQADLAIMLLSPDEPFAYAPIEAAVAGLPVVLPSNVSNAAYFPSKYPLLIRNRDDAAEVAEAISQHADSFVKRQSLSVNLFTALKTHLDLHANIIPLYHQYIQTILDAPAAQARTKSFAFCVEYDYARIAYNSLYSY
jgi:glycosyltransferase involved in cell wall biosynthesis